MPGIFGIILKDKSKKETMKHQFLRMEKYLTHFSYYKSEIHSGDDFIVGQIGLPFRNFKHLRYDQPTKRGMVFDGLMYGWRGEPLRSDPVNTAPVENIRFETSDNFKNVPTFINGSFNTILFDEESDSFYIVNSRMGNRSLYYYQNDTLIAFAPEAKAFLGLDSFKREVDIEGAVDFFNSSFFTGRRTLLKGVERIEPATMIEIHNRQMHTPYRYWRCKFTETYDGDGDLLAKQFYDKGAEVLERQMGSSDDFMIALSGGMDSRLLAHYCAESGRNVNYYSHGYEKSEDVLIAKEVADVLGVSNNYDEFAGDPESYAKLSHWTAWLVDGMTILQSTFLLSVIREYPEDPLQYEFLNSQFSGALNFGYGYGASNNIVDDLSDEEVLKRIALTYGKNYLDDNYYALFEPKIVEQMKKYFYPHIAEDIEIHLSSSNNYINLLNLVTMDRKAQRYMNSYDLYRFFYNWHFALIDDEIFEMLLEIPINLSVDRLLYKKIFCDHAPAMAKIRYEKSGVDLYSETPPNFQKRRRQKDMFRYYMGRLSAGKINLNSRHNYVQINEWYRRFNANRIFFESILLDGRTLERGYFNATAIKSLLKKQTLGSNNFTAISNLTMFELFNRYFIDGEEPPTYPS